MVPFPPVSPARPYTPPSPHPYAPHAQPISFSSILSPAQIYIYIYIFLFWNESNIIALNCVGKVKFEVAHLVVVIKPLSDTNLYFHGKQATCTYVKVWEIQNHAADGRRETLIPKFLMRALNVNVWVQHLGAGGGGRRKFNIQFSPTKEIGNISFVFFYLPLLFSLTACQKNLKWI